jgi:tight adherence protein C
LVAPRPPKPAGEAAAFQPDGRATAAKGVAPNADGDLGVAEPLALRLCRIHSRLDPSAFRVRQLAVAGGSLLAGALVAAVAPVPVPLGALLVAGTPLVGFLVIEQVLSSASNRWQANLSRELPVVAEQLAMLVNAGWSVGAALAEIASRGRGCVARDLARVVNRLRQGLSVPQALREWAEVARVEAVDRLVAVLVLGDYAADLGRLLCTEARQVRKDLQRRNVELMERRAQQVWIPVTVATLVPGVVLLAVPFLAALRLFSNT